MEFHSGTILETHDLVPYQSLGINRTVTLSYDSERADPRPIVHFGYDNTPTDPALRLVAKLSFNRDGFSQQTPGFAGGQFGLTGGEHFWTLPGGNIDAALQGDLRGQPSGRYAYTVSTGLLRLRDQLFAGSMSEQRGDLIHVNTIGSPFGSGWGLVGLQELIESSDGSALLIDGGSSELIFEPPTAPGNSFISPPGDFSRLEKLPDGTFRRTMPDQSVYAFDAQHRLERMRDRNGNEMRYAYDSAGVLTKITDPVGLETIFNSNQGRITSITDPAGRITRLAYDAAGNLTSVTDPDGSRRTWGYDIDRHMTSEIDQRGLREETSYSFAGRAIGGLRKDGSVLHFTPVQIQSLYPPESTINPLQAPVAFRRSAADATYVDGNGNVTRTTLDQAGQQITSSDAVGPLPTVQRNAQSLVTQFTDARGHVTRFDYDSRGNLVRKRDSLSGAGGASAVYEFDGTLDGDIGPTLTAVGDGQFQEDTVYGVQRPVYAFASRSGLKLDTTGLIPVDNYSLEFVMRFDDTGGYRKIVDFENLTLDSGFYQLNGNLNFFPVTSGGNFVAGVYQHVVLTRSAVDRRVVAYVNGVQAFAITDDQLRADIQNADDLLTFFVDDAATGGRESSAGRVARLRVYSDVLSPGEVAERAQDPFAGGGVGIGHRVFDYDPTFSQLTQVVDELGRATLSDIDPANGNARAVTRVFGAIGGPDDVTTQFTYTLHGLVDIVTDPLVRVLDHDYDALGRLIRVTSAKGTADERVQSFEYTAAGTLSASIDHNGNRSVFEYDSMNRLVRVTEADPDGAAGPLDAPITELSHDARGNLLQVTNPLDDVMRFEYDAMDHRIRRIDPLGGVTQWNYDPAGNLASIVDELGRETLLRYDARNRLVESTDPLGGHELWQYDDDDNVVAVTDENRHETRRSYDARSRLVRITDALGKSTRYEYDSVDNQIAETDRNGRSTRYLFDELDRVTSVTNPLAGVLTVEYDLASNMIAATDELGRRTQSGYDALDRLIQTTNPLGATKSFAFDGVDNLVVVTDELGRTMTYGYDALNRQVRSTDPVGAVRAFAFDPADKLVAVTDELGRVTQLNYDALNRLIRITDPLGHTTQTVYDAAGNTTSVTDPLGHTSQYVYDALDRQIRMTDARTGVTRYEYDPASNLARLTDPVGNATSFAYDELNRVKSETNALGAVQSFEYDPTGNLITMTDRNGRARQFQYDDLDRRTAERWLDPGGAVIQAMSYAFDAASQMSAARDIESTYGFNYDSDSRIADITNAGTPAVPTVAFAYTYDATDNLLTRSDTINGQAGGTNAYEYDALDRLTRVSQTGNGVAPKRVEFEYDAASQMTRTTRFADLTGSQLVATSNHGYDLAGRLTSLVHAKNATTLAQYSWTFDDANRITQATTPDGTSNYDYDLTDQIASAVHSFQSDEEFNYDLNGNRSGGGFQTGPNNRLFSDGKFNYEYDAEGNRIRRIDNATGEITEYAWDYRNRLVRVTSKSAGGIITRESNYSYDVFDRRIGKSIDTDGAGPTAPASERFVYDGDHIVLIFNGTGTQTHRYLHGPSVDQILADERSLTDVLWPLTDHQGTVRDLVDSTGTPHNHLTYDSFGNITGETNSAIDHQFSFTGREFDAETGLYYYRARYYDSQVGRFLSEDPLGFAGGSGNLYSYVLNSPVNGVDPFGLQGSSRVKQVLGGAFEALTFGLIDTGVDRGPAYFAGLAGGLGASIYFTAGLGAPLQAGRLATAVNAARLLRAGQVAKATHLSAHLYRDQG